VDGLITSNHRASRTASGRPSDIAKAHTAFSYFSRRNAVLLRISSCRATATIMTSPLATPALASLSTSMHHADLHRSASRGQRSNAALWAVLHEATRVAEGSLQEDPHQWWTKMGHTAQVPSQVSSLRSQLDEHPQLRSGTICEIGFNAGHSAVVWLEGTRARVVEFDLLTLPYSRQARRFVETRYPQRTAFHVGDSHATVPRYASLVGNGTAPACDLWLVDGDHGIHSKSDFFHALAASHDGTAIIADDAGLLFPYVRKYWRIHVGIGSIVERSCTSTQVRGGVEKTWCVGVAAEWAVGASGASAVRQRFDAAFQLGRAERNAAYFKRRRSSKG
jgi:hypothetical protein